MTAEPSQTAPPGEGARRRQLFWVAGAWLVLLVGHAFCARNNLSTPGLYYDEATFGGMAKDVVIGEMHGAHMPDSWIATLHGRPWPVFVQAYLGALKVWMLVPGIKLLGASTQALRLTNLIWAEIALLILLLGLCRWLGPAVAILTGILLSFDPNWFFLSTWDWGVAVPSLLCRATALCLLAEGWRARRWQFFLAGLFCGLGLFNKVDFIVPLGAAALALVLVDGRAFLARLRQTWGQAAWFLAGLALGAAPMLLRFKVILGETEAALPARELVEKFQTMIAMFDGSYFYRLMNAGGLFARMFSIPTMSFPVLGLLFLVALIVGLTSMRKFPDLFRLFSLLGLFTLLTLIGLFLLPAAARLHHWVLVYPAPHIAIALAAVALWRNGRDGVSPAWLRILATLALAGLLLYGAALISRTNSFIRQTGGRGWWSQRLDSFCDEIRNRTDLKIVSLDWGFHEQVLFLTNGPQAIDPVWQFHRQLLQVPTGSEYIYLAHAPEYSLLHFDTRYLDEARRGAPRMQVREFDDRTGHPEFYAISLRNE